MGNSINLFNDTSADFIELQRLKTDLCYVVSPRRIIAQHLRKCPQVTTLIRSITSCENKGLYALYRPDRVNKWSPSEVYAY